MSKWDLLSCSQKAIILSSEIFRSSRVFGLHFEVRSDLFFSINRQHSEEMPFCHSTWWTFSLRACLSPRIRGTHFCTCAHGAPPRAPPLRSTRRDPGGRRSPPRGRCRLSAQCRTRSYAALRESSSGLTIGVRQLERSNKQRKERLER